MNDKIAGLTNDGADKDADKDGQNGGDEAQADIEARARVQGWRPEEQYRGREPWLPADQYLRKIEEEAPVLRERNRFLTQEVTKRDKQLEGITSELTETKGIVKQLYERQVSEAQRIYEAARRDIIAEMDEAAKGGDVDTVRSKRTELEELDKNKPTAVEAKPAAAARTGDDDTVHKPAKSAISAVAQKFIDDNQNIVNDPVLYPISVGLHQENLNAGMSEAESFEKLADQIAEVMPSKFENANRRAPGAVRAPGAPKNPKPAGKTYDDLPEDDKRVCDYLVRTNKGFTREQYVKDYKW